MVRRLAALLLLPLVLAGCSGGEEPSAGDTPTPTSSTTPPAASSSATPSPPAPTRNAAPQVIGTVAKGLEVPWGIAFLPDGTALVTERDSGRVFLVGHGKVTRVGSVAEARANGEGGLLGVAVSPSYERDHRV